MIYGIGIDIIEVNRIQKLISRGARYQKRIFTENEIEYCESKKNKEQNYAARFAAKEAFMKAIGTGWTSGQAFNQIEIVNDVRGKPEIKLYEKSKKYVDNLGLSNIQVSLSHIRDFAIAIVIAEK